MSTVCPVALCSGHSWPRVTEVQSSDEWVLWVRTGSWLFMSCRNNNKEQNWQRDVTIYNVTWLTMCTVHVVHYSTSHHVTRLTTVSWSAVVSGSHSWSVCELRWQLALLTVWWVMMNYQSNNSSQVQNITDVLYTEHWNLLKMVESWEISA